MPCLARLARESSCPLSDTRSYNHARLHHYPRFNRIPGGSSKQVLAVLLPEAHDCCWRYERGHPPTANGPTANGMLRRPPASCTAGTCGATPQQPLLLAGARAGKKLQRSGPRGGVQPGQALTGSLSCFHLRLVNICKNHRRQQRGSGHPVRYRFSGWRAPGL